MNNKKIAKRLNKIAKELLAIEFPNQKAMNDYLKAHPLAERKNHKVVEFKPKQKQEEIQSEKIKLINPKNDEILYFSWHDITKDEDKIKQIESYNLDYAEDTTDEYVISGYEQDIIKFLKEGQGFSEQEIINYYY